MTRAELEAMAEVYANFENGKSDEKGHCLKLAFIAGFFAGRDSAVEILKSHGLTNQFYKQIKED